MVGVNNVANIDLSNCNNTPDLSKPISTLTQAALDLKAPTASPNFTGTVTVNNLPIGGITPITEGSITSATQNGPNTSGLSYTFVLSPYYSDSINVSCPIASIESGSFNP